MSWFGKIESTPREDVPRAIERFDPIGEGEAAPGVREQIAAAKAVAHHLFDSWSVKGEHFQLELGGHSDPGDGSTSPDEVRVVLRQVREAASTTTTEASGGVNVTQTAE